MTGSDAQPPEPTVRMLYCRCAFAQVVPADVKSAVLEGLAAAGRGFEGVADLCDMAARRDPHLADLAGLVQAFPRAVWAEGRNVAEDEVIKKILAKYGFDPSISDRYMLQAADSYARNLDEAVQRGVFGVPFTIVGDERFWGQDRLEDLDLHLAGKL